MLKQLIFTVCRVLTWVLSKPDLAFKISSQDRLTIKRRVLSLQGYSHTKDASSVVCLQFTFMVTCTSEHYLFFTKSFSFTIYRLYSRQTTQFGYLQFFRFKEFQLVAKVSSFIIIIVITYFYAGMFGCVLDFSSAGFQWFLTFLIGDLS